MNDDVKEGNNSPVVTDQRDSRAAPNIGKKNQSLTKGHSKVLHSLHFCVHFSKCAMDPLCSCYKGLRELFFSYRLGNDKNLI